ncbi:MAG: iron-sulfur cluster carrier protein ApbC [Gammaproteobacteria bacterium]|jgi:ATP-binding protein involved in chromosome partitioning|nr:iron-sulfur cluster carrier protein ApbC [Gammaproteobacteria bacterium]MBQ0775706.1 iron-sulfur cluster carrier protein ApbC [Gammaproteobacteria bacterium]|tara:strand:+ start:96858 stop:97940 length:1083 start_codon:yes stop_codon:yes gene_type:complete
MIEQQIKQALSEVVPMELGVDLISAGAGVEVREGESQVAVSVTLGYPFESVADVLRQQLVDALSPLVGARQLLLHLEQKIVAHRPQATLSPAAGIRNVIAVASGKGGVGKSTTAANLALALHAEGARVGLLDADVFGPSVPTLLGVPKGTKPGVKDGRFFLPVMAQGLQTMSMGYMIEADTPVVWRGPKASGALTQLFSQTLWDDLDYLIIDMPPGTGDIQLTLGQKVPVAGAVIVTTPQDLALADAVKGIEMFRSVGVGVLGIVENMSMHICSECGHAEAIFGHGGADRLVEKYATVRLGALPLSMAIRQQADAGEPTVVGRPDSAEAVLYRQVARRVAARLSLQQAAPSAFPRVITHG